MGCPQEGSKPGPRRNIRLLKANYIKEFSFLGQSEDPLDMKKCFLDLNSLQAREESAIRWVILLFVVAICIIIPFGKSSLFYFICVCVCFVLILLDCKVMYFEILNL